LNVIFIGGGIAVMSELLPPFAKNTAHVSEPAIGVIWFVFSAGVAIGQLPVVKLVEGRRRLRGLALMGVVWAGAFLVVLAGGAWFTGIQAAIVFAIAVGVFALAECLHGAIYAPLVVDLAEPQLAASSSSTILWLSGPLLRLSVSSQPSMRWRWNGGSLHTSV
jgi:predicted MFS family arabinose efflux permease